MTWNSINRQQSRRPGNKPVWLEKYPRIAQLMENTGLRVYEIAIIMNMHPDSLSRKLRFGTLSDTDTDQLVSAVDAYMKGRVGDGDDETAER